MSFRNAAIVISTMIWPASVLLTWALRNSTDPGATDKVVKTLPSCPIFPFSGGFNAATQCFCSFAGICPGCSCPQGCSENVVWRNKNTASFRNFHRVEGCSSQDDILTIPRSYYEHIEDLKGKCPRGMAAVIEDILRDGWTTYQERSGRTPVWHCIHHANAISVHWLHLHTFCSSGTIDGLPSSEGYCVVMSNINEAQSLANKITEWARGSDVVV
mmetsp:Transcript_60502/g.107825  ORF Transcript_60502/g.107825 Transcript_60502/m.107825 type:complete len:215 (+) Transcript_60502:18-662(+)